MKRRRPPAGDTEAPAVREPPPGLEVAFGAPEIAILAFDILPGDGAATLTASERTVAACIFEGLSNAEIAEARGTSVRTVANQVASLFRKLGVRSRSELIAQLAPVSPQPRRK